MNTFSLSNVSLRKFREYLFEKGCSRTSVNGGHEKWEKEGMPRPIILQTHIDPIPEFIIKNALNGLGIGRKEFIREIQKL